MSGHVHLRMALMGCTIMGMLCAGSTTRADDAPRIGINVGEMYPDFMLPKLDGTMGRLSDYRGKKVLLFHFASW